MGELGELYAAGPPYDEGQRQAIAAKIMEAAQMLEKGAAVDEIGRVVVEQEQTQDPDEALEAWLSTEIQPPADGENGQTALKPKVVEKLNKRGIKTYRDLLIVGSEKTADLFYYPRFEFRNLRDHPIMGELNGMLRSSSPNGVVWEARPSIEQIAALSNDLSEVTAYVLQFRDDLVGQTAPPTFKIYWASVQDMLDTLSNAPKPADGVTKAHQYSERGIEVALAAAARFAQKYEEAKRNGA